MCMWCVCVYLHVGVGSMKENGSGTLNLQCVDECKPTTGGSFTISKEVRSYTFGLFHICPCMCALYL